MSVCDFSSAVPSFPALKAAGIEGIITYCTRFNLSAALVTDALNAGLTVTLVMEAGSQPALRGVIGGVYDAATANRAADAAGYDKAAVIYYVAEDPNRLLPSEWPVVDAYFQAVNKVGGRPVGAYGGLLLVEHLISAGLATYGWVVSSWGGSSSMVHLQQEANQAPPAQFVGLIDMDTILQADYGHMPRPGVSDVPLTPADEPVIQAAIAAEIPAITAAVVAALTPVIGLLEYGDSHDAALGKVVQGHPFNLFQMTETLNAIVANFQPLEAAVAALKAQIAALPPPAGLAKGQTFTATVE